MTRTVSSRPGASLMKYLDGYRDPRAAQGLLARIRAAVTRPWTIMDACGAATHLLRFGIDRELPDGLELVHGPGCPVSLVPVELLDRAMATASVPGVILCTSGDLLRVPGSQGTLNELRHRGADVRPVYSPLDALALAKKNPERMVVFFAVGFETTAPTAAAAVREADRLALANFAILSGHVRMAPALASALAAPGCPAQAVLAAGPVATVIGLDAFATLAQETQLPVVITGTEPVDLLEGLLHAVVHLERGTHGLENQYARAVRPGGNPQARATIDAVFEPVDLTWGELGPIAACGLALRTEYHAFDAALRFPLVVRSTDSAESNHPPGCACLEMVTGRLRPYDCPAYGTRCTTDRPLGAPMAAPEGTCAAYWRFRRTNPNAPVLDRATIDVSTPSLVPRV
ncbi:MAG: hydrogenase formation protein HypD [Isosphaeraceae bacterium]